MRYLLAVPLFVLLATSCWRKEEPVPTVPDVVSDRVKELIQERQGQLDSVITSEESKENRAEQNEKVEGSPYKDLTDPELDEMFARWLNDYRGSCDEAIFSKYKGAVQKDLFLQVWFQGDRHALKMELNRGFKAIRDSCEGKGGI